jgi:hypothetical protein
MLAKLHQAGWDADAAVRDLAGFKKLKALTPSLSAEERRWLLEAVEDPDTLLTRERMQLLNRLVELNLVIDAIPEREARRWIDEPPPERDLELGVGRDVAWQTPLHREAVRRALEGRR